MSRSILDPNATTIEAISLMNGSATALTLVTSNILTNGSIPVSSLAYNWTVPTNLTLAAGNDCKYCYFDLLVCSYK